MTANNEPSPTRQRRSGSSGTMGESETSSSGSNSSSSAGSCCEDLEQGQSLDAPLLIQPLKENPRRTLLWFPVSKGPTTCALLLVSPLFVFAVTWLYYYFLQPHLAQPCVVPTFAELQPTCSHLLMHTHDTRASLEFLDGPEWLRLRRIFRGTGGRLSEGWDDPSATGWQIPVDFRYSPGQGRGIYTTTTTAPTVIPRGTKLWDSRYRAVFDNECAAKQYLQALSNRERCDAMFWGYSNNFLGHGMQFMVDLDGHGYLNHCPKGSLERTAEHHFEAELDVDSTQYGLPHWLSFRLPQFTVSSTLLQQRNQPGAHGLYAARDIQPGEQLCFDYGEVHMNAVLDYHNMMFQRALKPHQWMTK